MQPTRQQFGRHDHDSREQRTEEEALQRDGHGGDVKVWNEPEDEAEDDGGDEIDLQTALARARIRTKGCKRTYRDGQFLTHPRSHKPQDYPAHRNPQPEPRRHHPTRKRLAVPHAHHERDDPPAQRDLHADIQQQEYRTEPGYPACAFREQRLAQAAPAAAGATSRMLRVSSEDRAGILPEAVDRGHQLDDRAANLPPSVHLHFHPGTEEETNHDIIEIPPSHPRLRNQRRSNQRRKYRPGTVEPMQQAQHLVCVCHITDPGIPPRVGEPIAEPGEDEAHHENGVRRVQAVDDVGEDMARGGDDGHAAPAEAQVDVVVC